MDTTELVTATSPRLYTAGAAFYFDRATLARGKELGLDGFRFYFLGRGGVLGDVEWPVVYSAFGYFKPSLVEAIWDSARQVADPRAAGRAHYAACAEFGRTHLDGVEGLDAFCQAAEAVDEAVDAAGLTLYAGLSAEPRVDDLPGRAMQLAALLREHRGSAHLVAVVASGLSVLEAHYMRRPQDFETFGWAAHETPEITERHRSAQAAAEALTDALVAPAYEVLSPDQRQAFADGVAAISAALAQPAAD